MVSLPLRICKDPHEPGMIDGATLKTSWSMRCETLLLVGDMRGAVVVTSALFLRKFLLALSKFGLVTCHGANKLRRVCKSQDFYENHHIRIHFEKKLIRDSRHFMFFKEYFTKSIGPGQFSAE